MAHRGIEQSLDMRADGHGLVDIAGAKMQHRWLHCPAAPMDQRPLPPERASEDEWEEFHDRIEEFRLNWSFDRKESGLLSKSQSTKWICPARAGRVGCPVLGAAQVGPPATSCFPS